MSLTDQARASATILIADDDQSIRTVLDHALGRIGYDVRSTESAATLWQWVSEGEGDLVVTDVVMPDEDGLDLLERIKKIRPELPIIVMTAQKTLLTAIRVAERGAYEYLPKPFDLDDLAAIIKRSLEERERDGREVAPLPAPEDALALIGHSPAMQDVYRIIARLAVTELTVLITGESGTGKELVARILHDYGKRRHGPFVAISMAAIPRELVESELFGHEKGAFTGATRRNIGRFGQADEGTLFLDEIGDMPLEAQTRLLRVLQQGEYTRVGGRDVLRTNVRIIAATNRDLRRLVVEGRFREDLFYRLNVVPVRLPPLRAHKADIPELVRHFLAQAVREGLASKHFEAKAMDRLLAHDWPGNVRELENLVRRLIVLAPGEALGAGAVEAELAESHLATAGGGDHLDDNLGAAVEQHLARYFGAHGESLPPTGLYGRILREIERPLITMSLVATKGNQIRAAQLLGLNRNTLRKKIRDLDIPVVRTLK